MYLEIIVDVISILALMFASFNFGRVFEIKQRKKQHELEMERFWNRMHHLVGQSQVIELENDIN